MFKSLITKSLFRASLLAAALVGCSTAATNDSMARVNTDSNNTSQTATAATIPTQLPGRYVDEVFADVVATTDVVYANAPALVTSESTALHLDWYAPAGDTETARPAIVWVHGGAFRSGSRAATAPVAEAFARRGYVTASIDYRLDAGNGCDSSQSAEITSTESVVVASARCFDAVVAAQHDTQAAIRWLRANATVLGIDPERIAVGGFSAGAVTAVNVAQRSDDPGDIGDNDTQSSHVSAALVASGCNFEPQSIDADDAPLFLVASDGDPTIDFVCVATTERATIQAGGVVETLYFTDSRQHALALYNAHTPQIDDAWTAFLVQQLNLA